ncbi:uncharacterized protein [Procambarus clarkii]|uniref:uncharacterized protein n=1 Tax=Procambarus clarkii TaxID=6728 RepID=UPI001E672A9A|nr:uncharacterized protein LOC123766894 [Procambarus clarkii]
MSQCGTGKDCAMQSCDGKSCSYNTRCKMSNGIGCVNLSTGSRCGTLHLNPAERYTSKIYCDRVSPAAVTTNYQTVSSKVMKSSVRDDCYDTLGNGTCGSYVKMASLQEITRETVPLHSAECSYGENSDKPVHKIPVADTKVMEVTKLEARGDGAEIVGSTGMMRAGGRHQLVDIHGLAVFLRQSTRCLSCQAACCLYVTGTISAQLAAVTQVKITCQKCHYTASQALSRPATASDDSGSPRPTSLQPTPPADNQSPLLPTTSNDLHQSHSYISTLHQNSLKIPKEEQTSATTLPGYSTVRGTKWLASRSGASSKLPILSSLPSFQSLEEMMKEEAQALPSSTSSHHTIKPPSTFVDNKNILSTLDLCDSTHSCSLSATPPDHNKVIAYTHGSTAAVSSSSTMKKASSHCGSQANNNFNLCDEVEEPKRLPETQNHTPKLSSKTALSSHQTSAADSSIPCAPSLASAFSSTSSDAHSSSTLSPTFSSSIFPNSASALLKLLSSTVSSPPLPFTLPLYSALFQNTLVPDPLMETLEIKKKVEKGLEESLRLVRHMIQQGSASQPSALASPKEGKEVECKKDVQGYLQDLPISAPSDDRAFKNYNQMSGNINLQTNEADILGAQLFKRKNENILQEDKDKSIDDNYFLMNIPISDWNKYTKKNKQKKRSKLRESGKKRSYNKEHEHSDRKKMKCQIKHKDNQKQSSISRNEECKDSVDVIPKSLPVIHVRLVGSEFSIQNNKAKDYDDNIPAECTSFDTRQEYSESLASKHDLQNKNSGETLESRATLSPHQRIDCSHEEKVHRCKTKITTTSDMGTTSCCSGSNMDSSCCNGSDMGTTTCCSHSEVSNQCSQESSFNLNCKCKLLTMKNLRKSHIAKPMLAGCCNRCSLRKESGTAGIQMQDAKTGLRELANFFDRSTNKADEHGNFDISNEIISNLERNIKLVMHKNSMKMAIKSLLKKDARRNPKVQLRRDPKIAVGEMGVYEDVHDMERGIRECCFQGDNDNTSWRFHDLLSSDSGSSSDSDTSDGKLIIDTDS